MSEFLADPVAPVQLQAGGRLAVVSDGITEAFSPAGELLTDEPVKQLMIRDASQPQEWLTTLQSLVRQWQHGDDPKDDQTAVVVQRT
jgi:serine phosphatase RsbU (regulator of sigma subunit)